MIKEKRKINKEKIHDKIAHSIKWLNSLISPEWSHHLLPRWDDDIKDKKRSSKRESWGSRHQRLFKENVGKTKKDKE